MTVLLRDIQKPINDLLYLESTDTFNIPLITIQNYDNKNPN